MVQPNFTTKREFVVLNFVFATMGLWSREVSVRPGVNSITDLISLATGFSGGLLFQLLLKIYSSAAAQRRAEFKEVLTPMEVDLEQAPLDMENACRKPARRFFWEVGVWFLELKAHHPHHLKYRRLHPPTATAPCRKPMRECKLSDLDAERKTLDFFTHNPTHEIPVQQQPPFLQEMKIEFSDTWSLDRELIVQMPVGRKSWEADALFRYYALSPKEAVGHVYHDKFMLRAIKPLKPPDRILLGPGPSIVEPRVYQALGKPIVGHLDPYFFDVLRDVQELLRSVFGTKNQFTLALSGTGSSGMEAAVTNFVNPGSKVAVLANGFFCDRISEMAWRQGARVVRSEKPWGEVFTDDEAASFIETEKPDIVAYVQAETSTGAFQPGTVVCEAAHSTGALVIADCVTSLGGMPVRVDETGIDIAYSCSQKALSCPPGLAPITLSPHALEVLHARKTPSRSWYLDLELLDEYVGSARRYHHTAPISMFYALREALAVVAEEGLGNRWERHHRNHSAFVAGIQAMGMRMLVGERHRLWTLNTPVVPDGIDDLRVRTRLLDRYSIEISGGFGPLAGRIFRIGMMGAGSTEANVLLMLEKLEEALREEAYRPAASGRKAAEEFYASHPSQSGHERARISE